ncbi:response regulator [Achromobacter denitrificans]|uniref:response regulator n=1 Tax=Achromobacter denitrificans TaxID=32002 RepID=UPI001662E3B5|nr:response regulator [Achromobacter denitrificans]GFN27357.1 response regulator [Achromobacter denitrificans]
MKILIVEDDFDKRERIRNHVIDTLSPNVEIIEKESLRSGLRALVETADGFDLVLLDMSMPSFDITGDERLGGEPESFAGDEIMAQMKLRGLNSPVVVITQYKSFAKGAVGLEDLEREFSAHYSEFFQGVIYYNSALERWKIDLSDYLVKLKK